MTRLTAPAKKGDDRIFVDLDEVSEWQVEDKIALAPTGYTWTEGESFTIKSINTDEGYIELYEKVEFYHHGATEGGADEDAGIDVRGEVIHLTRPIVARGVEDYTVNLSLRDEGIFTNENEQLFQTAEDKIGTLSDGDELKDEDGRRFNVVATDEDGTPVADIIAAGGNAPNANKTIYTVLKKGDRWGGQIVTTDWEDTFYLLNDAGEKIGDTTASVIRRGRCYVEGVEFDNMSQYDTHRAAVRIQNAQRGNGDVAPNEDKKDPGGDDSIKHVIKNNSFHHGAAWAINVDKAWNVDILDNVVFYHVAIGFQVTQATNTIVKNNVIVMITDREFGTADSMMIDILYGLWICSQRDGVGKDPCPGLKVHNNIVAGTADNCASLPADNDGTSYDDATSRDNILHTCDYGVILQENDVEWLAGNHVQSFGW